MTHNSEFHVFDRQESWWSTRSIYCVLYKNRKEHESVQYWICQTYGINSFPDDRRRETQSRTSLSRLIYIYIYIIYILYIYKQFVYVYKDLI